MQWMRGGMKEMPFTFLTIIFCLVWILFIFVTTLAYINWWRSEMMEFYIRTGLACMVPVGFCCMAFLVCSYQLLGRINTT